jgi:type II secretion system protein I
MIAHCDHSRRRSAAAVRLRAGFTIVELLVALGIFAIGALAMAATSGKVMTMIASSQIRTVSATIAESRFERLRALPCAQHRTDSAVTRGIRETWTVVPVARADDVTVNIRFVSDHTNRSLSFQSFLPC